MDNELTGAYSGYKLNYHKSDLFPNCSRMLRITSKEIGGFKMYRSKSSAYSETLYVVPR